ncbi:MAG: MBL fold metallo-hydrolase [Hyphomicrobiales bacterium]
MKYLLSVTALVCCAFLSGVASVQAEPAVAGHITANTIRLQPNHPDSFRHFAPELPDMRARVSPINTEFGVHVSEIEPGLFFVTDQIYQSAFLVTDEGVVVFDAPPSFAKPLRSVIEMAAPDVAITHLIMSHGHSDHNGGGFAFADVADLTIIAAKDVADTLAAHPLPGILTPTRTFDDTLSLSIGGVPIELQTTHYHAEDTDVMIYLPDQKFLMAIDTITPGEVPFMNFGATTNVNAYFSSFDTFLSYDFEHFLSGHVSILGTRADVIASRDYAWNVRDTIANLMPSFHERMMQGLTAVEFQNANLAYRYAIESIRDECAAAVIDRWQNKLSVVDLWADSHCETTAVYSIMH